MSRRPGASPALGLGPAGDLLHAPHTDFCAGQKIKVAFGEIHSETY